MSNDLKRVGLVFTQEGAADFKKTLQDINLEMNKNYNQFKLTQAQWDKSTTSTQKLKAEQEYLTNAYEIQEDKIKTLRMQLSDLENAENKNTTAIKKKRNELTNAEVKLENYKKKIKEVENQLNNAGKKIEEFGTKIQDNGKKIEEAGKKLSAFSIATGTALVASAKSAIDFESAFTGVEKTVDGTEQQMAELKQGIRDMAKEIPSTTTEISAVAEAAGQLGIETDNILGFSKAMIDLGNSTNLTADEAASQLAKFANIMQMSQKDFDKLGSSIVDLGNNFATTEADIVAMAMRLAGAGKQVGLSEGQVLGLATALSSVGIEAEMGGSAISKAMVKMQNAVEQGGSKLNNVLKKTGMSLRELELMAANDSMSFKQMAQSIGMTSTEVKQLITAGTNLEDFAKISGMTAEEFKKAWKEDAAKALSAFIKGLGDAENKGESAITMLSEMGLTEVRLRDSLLRAANAGNLFNNAMKLGTKAWEENNALTNEANKRYDTLKSKLTIAINKIKDCAITLGNKLMPSISKVVGSIEKLTKWFSNLSEEQVDWIVKTGIAITAIGPLITIMGKLTSTIGGTIKGIGTFVQAIGVVKGTVTTTSTAVNGLAKIIAGLTGPVGLTTIAIGALTTGLVYFITKQTDSQKRAEEFAKEMSNSKQALDDYNKSIDETTRANLSQIDSVSELKDELIGLVDENGKVKEGYEGRVSLILNELNKALGTEYKLNGDVIQSYKTLRDEIDKTIQKKKAEIILNAEEEKYTNAIKNQEEAVKNLKTAHENLGMSIEDARTKYEQLNNEILDLEKQGKQASFEYIDTAKARKEIKNLIDAYGNAESQVKEYNTEIRKYEEDYAKFTEGKYNEIGTTITSTTKNWCDTSLKEINNSIKEQEKSLKIYQKIYEDTGDEVAKRASEQADGNLKILADELEARTSTIGVLGADEIQAWKTLASTSFENYRRIIANMKPEMQTRIQSITGVIANDTTMVNATGNKATEMTNMFDTKLQIGNKTKAELNDATKSINGDVSVENASGSLASDMTSMFERKLNISNSARQEISSTSRVLNNDNTVPNSAGYLAYKAEAKVRSNNSSIWGADMVEGLGYGIKRKGNSSWFVGILSGLAGKIASYLHFSRPDVGPLREYETWMPDMVEGLGKTLDKSSPRLIKSVKNMAGEMSNELQGIDYNVQGSTSVNTGNSIKIEIDYNKMSTAITKSLTNCKFTLDEDGFAKIVKDELYKVV